MKRSGVLPSSANASPTKVPGMPAVDRTGAHDVVRRLTGGVTVKRSADELGVEQHHIAIKAERPETIDQALLDWRAALAFFTHGGRCGRATQGVDQANQIKLRGRFDAEVLRPTDIGQSAEAARERDRADLVVEIEEEPADIP